DTGGETLARAMTLIETAKMNDLDPQAYLADVLDRIHDHKINRLCHIPEGSVAVS
ncbi:transposase domain-containing protein, partial [Roseovarius salinarum]|uniref:transposase domain-containing protein n=1 Tax=Roseovarius salinarum TaxID=1981892 RepID=UPI0018E45FA6